MSLSFTGILAATDNFDRIRLMVGHDIFLPQKKHNNYQMPFDFSTADADTKCVVIFTVPKRYKQHWLDTAINLRCQKVTVTAKKREYKIGSKVGLSLDIVDISATIKNE